MGEGRGCEDCVELPVPLQRTANNRGVGHAWLGSQRESLAMQIILAHKNGEDQVIQETKRPARISTAG